MLKKIWSWACSNDYLILVIPLIILDIMFWCAGLYFWGIMFLAIGFCFAATELVSYLTKGKTISEQFAAFRETHKVFAWAIIWALMFMFWGLIVHLATTGK